MILFLIGCMGLIGEMVLDRVYWGIDILQEAIPDFSMTYIFRSIIIVISIVVIFWSLLGNSRLRLRLDDSDGISFERLSIYCVLFISAICLYLFLFQTPVFSRMSLEDGIVENATAILLFLSFIVVAVLFFQSLNISNMSKSIKFSFAFLSIVLFVVAMEEVSWFQRVFDVKTPTFFATNLQGEMNLHNFCTNQTENIYYFGTFIFLVIMPFIRFLFPNLLNNNYLKIFLARPYIAVIGSVASAYNYDMWNIIFTQVAFFGSVFVLLLFFIFSYKKSEKYLILFVAIFIVATQIVFILNGTHFARIWEVTEYKEFFISFALFVYSVDIFAYTKRTWLSKKVH